ncbi:FASCICLIN-like arabinogalactan protein 18 precursor [Actinidia rufa]|uniref:FASCICLIN-like arabinogalactan protein 18 n=1 Tax=Actinidia rufa TaxID=165716 RepID=A0A7J0F4D7_9ERIC|nr:FASCICLIN-like arabinogalactan protein 18 precursor [Actinidia rufa]
MDPKIYGVPKLFLFLLLPAIIIQISTALPAKHQSSSPSNTQINSNSVLVALLDSHYTELAELVEKALLLPTLEAAVNRHNITVFAPRNEALERDLDPEFKRFLLEPRNLRSLQTLLLFHIVPARVDSPNSSESTQHNTLSNHRVKLTSSGSGQVVVDSAKVVRLNDVVRPDGVIHGIERMLVPRSVEEDFNRRRSLRSISAVLPEGAPEDRLLAPAPAPGPGGPHGHFDGEAQVKDFIQTLLHYGGYNELADILVNLTSLATEMGRLVSEGYVLTVLAPNDEAMAKLATERLSEAGAAEQIVYYHLIPEYQTEESMYNAVRRFGKVRYDTLRLPHKVMAEEADGSVRFGSGDGSAYLFDPDIYTDGRISVQGIDGVLFPAEEAATPVTEAKPVAKFIAKPRRGMVIP